ncbi:MerR family transcriptional regulator [Gracilibacillus dipsosauri]|uniref:MerR family transcriptional regulator n=1 Tax=Gracilibacillus dipsosauri TaxID=178340 RepID=UPI0024099A01
MITKKYWKVGELAKLTGLTIRTLRYYDQIGLFIPSEYTSSGYRLYNESDIKRLQQILALKELDISLEEIKAILASDDYNPLDILYIQMDRMKKNIHSQQILLKELQHVVRLMQKDEELTIEHFTMLLQMMRKSHEEYFLKQKTKVDQSLDRLQAMLTNQQKKEEDEK